MEPIINIVPDLSKLTHNNELEWEQNNNTPCYYSVYKKVNIVICRVPTAAGKMAVSLNYLDENYMIIGSPNKWEQDQPEYADISSLYDEVIRKSNLAHAS